MEFAIISPTAGLERYATLSKTHLVLAHLEHLDYCNFYLRRKEAGDFLILDNGGYEGFHLPIQRYIDKICMYKPNVAVLPDFLLKPWKMTWHAAIYFLDQVYDELPDIQWCYIPQAEKGDIHGFIESYQEAVTDERITWLGIPRALAYAINDNPLMRVEFARMVRRDNPRLKLHAFGMVNGDVHEIPYLRAAGVTSIDSSAPVWRGWNGQSMLELDRRWWDEFGTSVDFNAELPTEIRREVILDNLEACGVRIPNR